MSPIPDDPSKRLGIYKRFEDIPAEHRLESYRDQYRGRDTWGEFLTQVFLPQHNTYQTQQEARRLTRKWRTVVSEAGRHHALARPRDLERWWTTALEEVNPSTAYRTYWTKLERFYDWLLWHPNHPHRYNPLLMAAANYDSAGTIWTAKVGEKQA